jgi:hypothetical protein
MDRLYTLRLWLAVRRAKQRIKTLARKRCPNANVFSKQGPRRIEHQPLAIFITTATDEESGKLRDDPTLYKQLRDTMLQAGYPPDAIPSVKFRIESQETVDRDYGGSWAEAIEMP